MCYVLPLRFRDGLSVRGSEWVIGDWPVVYNMCNGVDEDPLSLGQAEDDGVVLRGDDGGFLAIYDPGRLVAVFSKQDLHVFQRVDWGAFGHGCTWNSGEKTLILEEMCHDDVIRDFTNQNATQFENTETEKGPGRERRHERGKNKVTDANATTETVQLCKSFKLR